jgi:hypothetical protein
LLYFPRREPFLASELASTKIDLNGGDDSHEIRTRGPLKPRDILLALPSLLTGCALLVSLVELDFSGLSSKPDFRYPPREDFQGGMDPGVLPRHDDFGGGDVLDGVEDEADTPRKQESSGRLRASGAALAGLL